MEASSYLDHLVSFNAYNANAALNFNGGTLKSSAPLTISTAGLPINILGGGATAPSTASGGNITFGSGLAFSTASTGNLTIQGGNTLNAGDATTSNDER